MNVFTYQSYKCNNSFATIFDCLKKEYRKSKHHHLFEKKLGNIVEKKV